MSPDAAERWMVDLIRNADLDAKIDSDCIVMASVSQSVYERTRDIDHSSRAKFEQPHVGRQKGKGQETESIERRVIYDGHGCSPVWYLSANDRSTTILLTIVCTFIGYQQ